MTDTAIVAPPGPAIEPEPDRHRVGRSQRRSLLDIIRIPLVASLVLLAIYATFTLALNDPRGTLGTDTGGKLATLRVMERNGGLDPDVGYWAAADDPAGTLHPLYYTFRVGEKWVNATTLPMLYAAYPLYVVGGDRAVLLLPMLGALLCALAARALARRLGAKTGWAAFWIIGLATPVAIYALDFWEHSLGLGLMLWGYVCFQDVADGRAGWRRVVSGGLLFGAAATMRTEALLYFAVAGLVSCVVVLHRRRRFSDPVGYGIAMLGGLALPLVLEQLLEEATLGGSLRAGRAGSTADAVGSGLGTRIREAFMTTLGLNRFELTMDIVVGALILALVLYGVFRLARNDGKEPLLGIALIAVACMFIVFRFTDGLGFVSGLLTASPLAAIGLLLGWRRRTSLPLLVGALALPLVWAFQYSGGAGPQWGGRYQLLSGALFAVVGIVILEGKRAALVAATTVAALVTGFGLAWLSQRSTTVAEGMDAVVARHDQAVVSLEAHALREGGAFYVPTRRWLTATNGTEFRRAVRILRHHGATEFAVVASDGRATPAHVLGYARGGAQRVVFLRPDIHLEVVTYRSV